MFLPLKNSRNLAAAFSTFELKAPANPRSPVTSTSRMFCSGRCASRGCFGSPVFGIDQIGAADQRAQDVGNHQRVRPGRQRAFLCAPQLGRRDHLHGLGNLARVLHAADSPPDVANVRHWFLRTRLRHSLMLTGEALLVFLDDLGHLTPSVGRRGLSFPQSTSGQPGLEVST